MQEIIVDNFAGGGGASCGIEEATGSEVDVAVNHDPYSISMHTVNHPNTVHYCEDVWNVDPRIVAAGRPIALNWLSPSCTHHSNAAGGVPKNKQLRGQAWLACRWAATVKPRTQILENVKEFRSWGPLMKNGQPDPKRKGLTYNTFVNAMKRQGYAIDTNLLTACDYGAPTSRERFFMIMRRDGRPIVWPEPTHGDPNSYAVKSGRLKPWRTAAEIIDWSIPCPSIFERKKPLANNTLRRIARGLFKFIINEGNPFIAPIRSGTAADHGELVTAFLAQYYTETVPGEVRGQSLNSPIMTIPTANRFALVTSHLVKFKGTNIGQPMTEPLQTITAGGNHFAECRAFLIKYYGQGVGQGLNEPLHTIPTKDRFGLVMVHGTPYQIIDIGMRMLEPHELFAGNGFPQSYIIDRGADGRRYPKSEQVARCGNSVPPAFAKALVQANLPELCTGSGKQFAFYRYNPAVTPSGQLELSI